MATQTHGAAAARGRLQQADERLIVLALPGSDYRLHLAVDAPVQTPVGKPVTGRIVAQARRVDVVTTGGRFIEPVYGRPRRLQGTVVETNESADTITVQCAAGGVFECRLMRPQRPTDFQRGQLVAFDVERGAKFEPL